jgi:hypothetical protein
VDRNVNIITDLNGNKIAVINDIVFKGKRNVDWSDVEQYLRQYIGEFYQIAETKDVVYIGSDLPDEYANSNYTHRLKGASAKAKANAAQGLPEMIEIASGKHFEENRKEKHNMAGIDMNPVLHYLYLVKKEKWRDIMSFMC